MMEALSYNAALARYEMPIDQYVVYADVRREDDVLTIKYVYAPPELRGTGAASRFMQALIDQVRAESLKVIPVCGYAASWIARHQDAQDLLA